MVPSWSGHDQVGGCAPFSVSDNLRDTVSVPPTSNCESGKFGKWRECTLNDSVVIRAHFRSFAKFAFSNVFTLYLANRIQSSAEARISALCPRSYYLN